MPAETVNSVNIFPVVYLYVVVIYILFYVRCTRFHSSANVKAVNRFLKGKQICIFFFIFIAILYVWEWNFIPGGYFNEIRLATKSEIFTFSPVHSFNLWTFLPEKIQYHHRRRMQSSMYSMHQIYSLIMKTSGLISAK